MSISAIRAALETALNALSPSISTSWENVPFEPAAGVPYQAVALLLAEPDNLEFGPSFFQRGFMQASLRYPLNTGPAAAAARAEVIRDAFYRGRSLVSGVVTVIIDATPEIAPAFVDGDRYSVPVTVRFFAQISA